MLRTMSVRWLLWYLPKAQKQERAVGGAPSFVVGLAKNAYFVRSGVRKGNMCWAMSWEPLMVGWMPSGWIVPGRV